MSNSKLIIALATGLLLSFPIFGQQKPVLSLYMFNELVLNPAYSARHDYTTMTAMYRDQWINIPGAPTLTTFAGHTGFKDRNIGAGFMISEDRIGVHNNLSIYGSYAYIVPTDNDGKLSLGLQGGMDILRSDWSQLTLDNTQDPVFSGTEINYFPNFGTGVYYFTDNYYVGLSVPYILTNRKTRVGDQYRGVEHSRNYYLSGGYVFTLNPKVKLKPSVLVKVENDMPLGVDLNLVFYYDELIDVGVSYRTGNSVLGLFGFQANKFLKFSYAYAYILSDLGGFNNGTHELMLQYRINFAAPRHNRMCPSIPYF